MGGMRGVQRAGDVMRFERKPQDFQYGKTPLSLAFLPFCMGSFEVRVTILNQGDSYQRTLSVFRISLFSCILIYTLL